MIAKNFIRFPEALAVQLCLNFGALVRWATARPGSRVLRAIRTARSAAMRLRPFVRPDFPPLCVPESKPTPPWFAAQQKRARALAKRVQALTMGLTYARG